MKKSKNEIVNKYSLLITELYKYLDLDTINKIIEDVEKEAKLLK